MTERTTATDCKLSVGATFFALVLLGGVAQANSDDLSPPQGMHCRDTQPNGGLSDIIIPPDIADDCRLYLTKDTASGSDSVKAGLPAIKDNHYLVVLQKVLINWCMTGYEPTHPVGEGSQDPEQLIQNAFEACAASLDLH